MAIRKLLASVGICLAISAFVIVLVGCGGGPAQSAAPPSVLSLNQPAAVDDPNLSARVWVEDFHCALGQCMFLVHYAAAGSAVVSADTWRAFADGQQMEHKYLPDGGPRPALPAITIATGQTVAGWIYFVSPPSVTLVELDLLAFGTGGTLASWEMAATQ